MKRLLSVSALLFAGLPAVAETLVGHDYAGGRISSVTLGDSLADKAIGSVWVFDAFGSTPINDQVDTILGAGHGFGGDEVAGIPVDYSTTFITTEFRYQFAKDEPINPFVIGGPFVRRQSIDVDSGAAPDIKALNLSENSAGVSLGGGAEFELGSSFLAKAQLDVRVDTDLEVTAQAGGQVGWWALEQLLGSLGLGWDSENGDLGVQLIATWKLP